MTAGIVQESRGMDTPVVTVGILSWNRRDAIPTALESVRKQTIFERVETLVLDNGSCDGTVELVRERYPWVRLESRTTNSGLAGGRNLLVRMASAPLVFWMDDDCELVENDLLQRLVDAFAKAPTVAVVYGQIIEEKGRVSHVAAPADAPSSGVKDLPSYPFTFASGGTCIRKDAFLRLGGYDEDFFRMQVENDYALRLFREGWLIRYWPDVHIIHRPHQYGRNDRVITFYSFRNHLWGLWKTLPLCYAVFLTAMDCVMYFARAFPSPSRLVGCAWGGLCAVAGLPRKAWMERVPMRGEGLRRWCLARHYLITTEDDFGNTNDRYGLARFAVNELRTRVFARLGFHRTREQMMSPFRAARNK